MIFYVKNSDTNGQFRKCISTHFSMCSKLETFYCVYMYVCVPFSVAVLSPTLLCVN